MRLPASVATWWRDGTEVAVDGQRVFVVDRGDTSAVPVVLLHGFPGSSHDWRGVIPRLADRTRVLAVDLPGFGLSAKPARRYSLFDQADIVEALLAQRGIDRCVLVAHDMGDTVAAELLARGNEARLGVAIERVILTNGSIFIDQARLTAGQRLGLALPNRRLPLPLPSPVLRRSLAESFAAESPAPPGELDAMVALIRHGGGGRLMPVLIRYIEERRVHQPRWTAGLVDYLGPMTAIWGELDPIAVPAMVERLAELRPATEVVRWPDVGHWPCVEQPARLADAIADRL